MSIWIVLFIGICFLFFYYYILSTFVHFMNTYLIVPIIKFINIIIKAINIIIDGINKPFKSLHEITLGFSAFGRNITIFSFDKIIPKQLVPSVPELPYKCIDEPVGYKSIFRYKTPKECLKKSTKKKKKKKMEQVASSLMNGFIIILLCLLLFLLYIGMQEVDKPSMIENVRNPILNGNNNSSSEVIQEGNNILSNISTSNIPTNAITGIPTSAMPNNIQTSI